MSEGGNSQNAFLGESPKIGSSIYAESIASSVYSKTYQRPSPLQRNRSHAISHPNNGSEHWAVPFMKPTEGYTWAPSRFDGPATLASSLRRPGPKPKYELIRPGTIRLLRLEPSAAQEAPLHGRLVYKMLEDVSPNYTAISYAWGSREEVAIIHLNEQIIGITASVLHALSAVRTEDDAVFVWIDALSINQQDVEELNSQVRIMDSIYRGADTVAICLGPHSDSENSRLAFDYLTEISRPGYSPPFDWDSSREDMIMSVVCLFERDYWKRLWVMQEVFHAKNAKVYCGSDSILLDKFFAACRVFSGMSLHIESFFPGGNVTQTSKNHYSYAQTLTTQGPNTLLDPSTGLPESPLEILRICRGKLAVRPQDKVLGVLSLLPQNIRSMFQPNFHLTPQEVFTDIAACIFKASASLDVICESIRYPFHQNSFGLPSWVPDWSHFPDTLSLAATRFSHRLPFQACSSEMQAELCRKTPVFGRDELRIHGIPIGVITARGMSVGTLGRLSNYLMAFLEWRHLLLDDRHYRRSHEVSFCRTLCLGDIPQDVYPTLDRQYGWIGYPEVSIEAESSGSWSRRMHQWKEVTFRVFAELLGERLRGLPLDEELQAQQKKGRRLQRGRQFLQEYFGDRMMGRCFCLLESGDKRGYMGMGTGYMGVDDLVVIAYGCSTPIAIRPTNQEGKYEFVGDVYVDGCMDGDVANPQLLGTAQEFVLS